MRKLIFILALSLSLYSGALSTSGNTLGVSNMFSQSSVSLGIKVGSASIGNESYTIAGLSGNYFIMEDLSVGLGYEKWFSGDPDISKITIESTYYFPVDEKVRPYAGVLYRRVMIGNSDRLNKSFDDIDSYGYRVGIAFVQEKLLLSAGIVQEKYDTKQGLFDDTETYAELTIGFMF